MRPFNVFDNHLSRQPSCTETYDGRSLTAFPMDSSIEFRVNTLSLLVSFMGIGIPAHGSGVHDTWRDHAPPGRRTLRNKRLLARETRERPPSKAATEWETRGRRPLRGFLGRETHGRPPLSRFLVACAAKRAPPERILVERRAAEPRRPVSHRASRVKERRRPVSYDSGWVIGRRPRDSQAQNAPTSAAYVFLIKGRRLTA